MSAAASVAAWLWVPVVIGAALAQTARNAAQRSLVAQAGTLGATLARFLYGLPFAGLAVLLLHVLPAVAPPVPNFGGTYFPWLLLGATSQIAATAFLLAAMKQRNFVVGVAFSKTDALQVAVLGALFLGELPGWVTMAAIALASTGVLLLSLPAKAVSGANVWNARAALYGLASGAGFAMSAVAYRGAALQAGDTTPWLAGMWAVLWAQTVQTLLLGSWLLWRDRAALRATFTAWRVSTVAGAAGALASGGWFTAFVLTTAANVRTLGMVEVVFSYLVSRRLMREKLSGGEQAGLLLVMAGLVVLGSQL